MILPQSILILLLKPMAGSLQMFFLVPENFVIGYVKKVMHGRHVLLTELTEKTVRVLVVQLVQRLGLILEKKHGFILFVALVSNNLV